MEKLRTAPSIKHIEAIAKCRFGFSTAAALFHKYLYNPEKVTELNYEERSAFEESLINTVKNMCSGGCLIREPQNFLAKQIVREYGFPCLEKLETHHLLKEWIVPELKHVTKVNKNFATTMYVVLDTLPKKLTSVS